MSRVQAMIAGLLLGAGACLCAYAVDPGGKTEGEWSLNNWVPGDSVHLKMKHRTSTTHWQWGTDQPLGDLHGLTRDQLHAAHADVAFTLRRDAGTFAFEGSIILGIGGGKFRFVPDPSFAAKLGALGFEPVTTDELFGLALRDVSLAFAEAAKGAGLVDVTLRDLLRFRDHGIDADSLRDLASIGMVGLTGGDVVRFQDHGIDADYLRGLKSSGYPQIAADDIVRLHDHGIDAEFVKGLVAAGYTDVRVDDIIRLHDHGVDPEYVARVRSSGFGPLTVEQIVKLHDHGVD